MKYILITLSILIITACSSKDDQFCECMTAGEELSIYGEQFMERGPSEEEVKKWEELRTTQSTACLDYQEMSGDEMRQRKEECEK
ncbi:MAG: hypothetical protein QNK23_01305 [Crocinitomicaceae bacterium]|nr:hypothetical protein [Crocinitomicaceae bacterium]